MPYKERIVVALNPLFLYVFCRYILSAFESATTTFNENMDPFLTDRIKQMNDFTMIFYTVKALVVEHKMFTILNALKGKPLNQLPTPDSGWQDFADRYYWIYILNFLRFVAFWYQRDFELVPLEYSSFLFQQIGIYTSTYNLFAVSFRRFFNPILHNLISGSNLEA